jgi:hypothetical protein
MPQAGKSSGKLRWEEQQIPPLRFAPVGMTMLLMRAVVVSHVPTEGQGIPMLVVM